MAMENSAQRATRSLRATHYLAQVTALLTFLLVTVGAVVVDKGAGLSVPDWPLSFGMLMPPMRGGVLYEHGHRMLAGLTGILTFVLALWIWRVERRKWVCRLGLACALTVVAQAVLGGLTVLYLLPKVVVVGHACLAQLFFCMALTLAVVTSPSWNCSAEAETPPIRSPRLQHLCCVTTVAIFVQLILGAARRHRAFGLAPHLAGAVIVTVLVLFLAFNRLSRTLVWKRTRLLMVLLVMQLALGLASYLTRLRVPLGWQSDTTVISATTAHVAVGALLLGFSLSLALTVYRKLSFASKPLAIHRIPERRPA
jgi:cytochrome c oxidase assembly protein subunit 15